MRSLIVYESMYGNTRAIAEAVAAGMRGDVEIVHVSQATEEMVTAADLLVVGAPTHVHTMPSKRTRDAAIAGARKNPALTIEPDADTVGVREWLTKLPLRPGQYAAAFDTRMPGPAVLTGRASCGIARRMHRAGRELIDEPHSFVVSKDNVLPVGSLETALMWGNHLYRELLFRHHVDEHTAVNR